jgi:DNA-binding MarR family transcriptional regulator
VEIDPSYLTRILQRLKYDGIVTAAVKPADRRRLVEAMGTIRQIIEAYHDRRA